MAAVPADLLRKHLIPIPAAYVGTGGVSDFHVLMTRAQFNDEILDPSGDHARSDGGDVRFSTDSTGSDMIACKIVNWELDSSSGARDADILVIVKVPTLSAVVDNAPYVHWFGTTTTAQPSASDTYGANNALNSNCKGLYLGTTTDQTSNGNNLTAVNSPGTGTGKVGSSFVLDGSTQYLYGNAGATAYPCGIMAWVKPDANTSRQSIAQISSKTTGTDNSLWLNLNSAYGGVRATVVAAGSERNATTTVGHTSGAWQHAAAVNTSNTLRSAYIDNGSEGTNIVDRTPSALDTFFVGVAYLDSSDSYTYFFDGEISCLSVWANAPTAAWRTTDYNLTNNASWGTPGDTEVVSGGTTTENITGTASITFGESGTLKGIGRMTGTASIGMAVDAALTGIGRLSGSASMEFSESATLMGYGRVSGTSSLTFSQSGDLFGYGRMSGTSGITFSESADLYGIGQISGASSIAFDASGTLSEYEETVVNVSGTSGITFTAYGTLTAQSTFGDGMRAYLDVGAPIQESIECGEPISFALSVGNPIYAELGNERF